MHDNELRAGSWVGGQLLIRLISSLLSSTAATTRLPRLPTYNNLDPISYGLIQEGRLEGSELRSNGVFVPAGVQRLLSMLPARNRGLQRCPGAHLRPKIPSPSHLTPMSRAAHFGDTSNGGIATRQPKFTHI